MENNSAQDELLIEYLVSELTVGEKDLVESWINASEENHRYFESLKQAWQLSGEEKALNYVLDELNVEDKWDKIRQVTIGNEARIVSINDQLIAGGEHYDRQENRKPGIYKFFVRSAVAASVLLVLSLGWKFFTANKQELPFAKHEVKGSDSLVTVVRHEVNTTGKEKRVQLPDGSLIVLADKSEITYREPFSNKRDITLIGKAFFKVAKDKTMPFTVFSGDISTTALGTEFTITASQKNNRVIVRLYEGKVVVKAVEKSNKKMKNDIYLLPGQAFVYGSQEMAKVKEFEIEGAVAPEQIIKQELPLDNPSIPENAKGSYFMFNNQSLDEVFEHLAGLYNVKIIYNKDEVKDLYLIGKYNNSDSLEIILRRIATLNTLTVIKKDDAYIISK